MIRVGVVGLGHWGPNLVRNFGTIPDVAVTACCDSNPERVKRVCDRFVQAKPALEAREMLCTENIDAVAIATPSKTHYSIAKLALEKGLHVFVEKPLATSLGECEDLIQLAKNKDLVLMVGHIFLYNAAVIKLKELVDSGELGDLCYLSSARLNLGPIRQDVNALWDLSVHDISIMLHLMDCLPISVNCQGLAYVNKNVHDVCVLTLEFESGTVGFVHCSWLDPKKVRYMAVVGKERMATYDDLKPTEKIIIYDKKVEKPLDYETFGEFQFSHQYGDMYTPRLQQVEPLKAECEHFIDCIKRGAKPKTDGQNGLEVVRVLELADMSLQNHGGKVYLNGRNS